jgi:hypothetical protein
MVGVVVFIHVLAAILSIGSIGARLLTVMFGRYFKFIQQSMFVSTGSLIASGLILNLAGRGSIKRVCLWGASSIILIGAIEILAARRQAVNTNN